MKKRTILAGTLLMASLASASTNSEESASYISEHTGSNQKTVNELCLKVDTMSIASMGPHGFVSSVIGLQIDQDASQRDVLVDPDFKTKECDTGYIKITTTAPLRSLRNAPVGL